MSWIDGPHPYKRWIVECDCEGECNCNSDEAINKRMAIDGVSPVIFNGIVSELAEFWGQK